MAYLLGNWAATSSGPDRFARLNQAQNIWTDLSRQFPRDPAIIRAAKWIAQQVKEKATEDSLRDEIRAVQSNTIPNEKSGATTEAQPANHSPPEYPLRLKASDSVRLRENAGQFARIRGRIASARLHVGKNRLSFIQFGTTSRDFVALVHQNVLPYFQEAYGNYLEGLIGQDVEVEGILSVFSGTPQTALNRPDQIHILTVETNGDRLVFQSSAIRQLRENTGNSITVEGRVSLVNSTPDGSIHFLEFENRPDAKFTALIRDGQRIAIEEALGGALPQILPGRRVKISGIPYLHQGNPNIEIREPAQITLLTNEVSK